MLYIGPHVSISESIALSVERAYALGATGFALFTKNQRQWKSSPLKDTEVEAFRKNLTDKGYSPAALLPHAGYLINPASPDPELRAKSEALFQDEVSRLEKLGIGVINIHPGAYKEGTKEEGLDRTASMMDAVLEAHPGIRIAVENTAGAGTILGSTFEELAGILERTRFPERLGFTLDTAHLFGAGYDVKSDPDRILDQFFSLCGKGRLYGMHLNDSKVPLASNKDRHESIGLGLIGSEPFHQIVRREEVQGIPLILETPDESRWASEIKELLDAAR